MMKKTLLLLVPLTALAASSGSAVSAQTVPGSKEPGRIINWTGTGGYETEKPATRTKTPLKRYYTQSTGDNFTAVTPESDFETNEGGYLAPTIEGLVFTTQVAGTIALTRYYNEGSGDNLSTTTAQGMGEAKYARYRFVRIEGYIYRDPTDGTVPLKRFYSKQTGDNLTTATAAGEQEAKNAGYHFVGIEGYILPAIH